MGLPLSKKATEEKPPSETTIKKISDVAANTLQAAEYFLHIFEKKFMNPKMLSKPEAERTAVENTIMKLFDRIKEFVTLCSYEMRNNGSPWLGLPNSNPTAFKNMHANRAEDVSKTLKDEGTIVLGFSIDKASQFLRAFSSNQALEAQKPLEQSKIDSLDKLFIAWLAKNNIFSQDNSLFQSDDKGKIKLDDKNMPVKVDPDVFTKLLNDAAEGFDAFLRTKGLQATILNTAESATAGPKKEATVEIEEAPAAETTAGFKGSGV